MTMVEAVILLGFGVPIAAACMAFVVMACRMQNEENAKLAAQHQIRGGGALQTQRVFVHSMRIKLGADVESSVLKRL